MKNFNEIYLKDTRIRILAGEGLYIVGALKGIRTPDLRLERAAS